MLACDESGSKGYADSDEAFPGETGVFAGLMVPAEVVAKVASEFDAVAAKYATPGGKLHITDLSPENQAALRNEMFGLIRSHKLPCFYEAIHVAGFHRAHKELSALVDKARASHTGPVIVSGGSAKPSSLHVALFQGLYGKVLAFCDERDKRRLHIEVRTDRVDSPIVKHFQGVANELLDFGANITRVTGFDTETKKIVEGSVTVRTNAERLPITVEHLEFKVVDDRDGLVVAADVLANSLDYLFRTRPPEEKFRALNTPDAFHRHALKDCLDSFWNWGGYNFSDSFYRHPRDPALRRDCVLRRIMRRLFSFCRISAV
jgi:hypothetical protein